MNETNYLPSTIKQFEYYRQLGEQAMRQLPEAALFHTADALNNSIATLVKHLWGNMQSRWTNFRQSDGEKPWRDRDAEFENDLAQAEELWQKWDEGWTTLLDALKDIDQEDLAELVYIRHQGHTMVEAINRQLAHYAYHVGQIVLLAKLHLGTDWQTLSIAKGQSKAFNAQKFSKPPERGHFTDDFLSKT